MPKIFFGAAHAQRTIHVVFLADALPISMTMHTPPLLTAHPRQGAFTRGTLHSLFWTCPSLVCAPSAPSPAVIARSLLLALAALACFQRYKTASLSVPVYSPLNTTVHRLPTNFTTDDPFPLRHRFATSFCPADCYSCRLLYGLHVHLFYKYRRLCVNPAPEP